MDLKDKKLAGEENEESSSSPLNEEKKKSCTDCKTTTTPLWRGGPAGPKTLCNACGIKYNKKRRAQIKDFNKTEKRTSKTSKQTSNLKVNVRLMVVKQKQKPQQQKPQPQPQQQKLQQQQHQRKRSTYERGKPWWNKLQEEEQAAILLMAISCGGRGSLC